MHRIACVIALALNAILLSGCASQSTDPSDIVYEPNWNSLSQHRVPQWFRNAKFGIYTHWGVYAVPAYSTAYSGDLYLDHLDAYKHHVDNWGDPSEFGYKEFIPMFKAENFDPDEWAELFKAAGAQFAGPVAEHHDGFSMWDSELTSYDTAERGPKRDVVGELAEAIRKRDMKFVTSFHHATHWFWYPHWIPNYDTADPRYTDLYGPLHDTDAEPENFWRDQQRPNQQFHDIWRGKVIEVIDKYEPDMIWFDFQLDEMREDYLMSLLAYYFNHAEQHDKEVLVTYKRRDLPPGIGTHDLERKLMRDRANEVWLTDSSMNLEGSWGYATGLEYQSVNTLVDNLVDRVAKNGCLLLNVGPKADGSIPEPIKQRLLALGAWLKLNGEAIYETIPWTLAAEGPTRPDGHDMHVKETPSKYTAEDIRYTVKGEVLYAIILDWPGEQAKLKSLKRLYPETIAKIELIGDEKPLAWQWERHEGVTVQMPDAKPCEHAFVLRITRKFDEPVGGKE